VSDESRQVRDLLDKLVELSRAIEAHRAALYLLERERMQLQTQLAATGWKPEPTQEGLL
jgi:hypothetical protein